MNICKYLTVENKGKAVKLRGLPFNASEDEIMEFFKNYNIVRVLLIFVEKNRYNS